MSPTRERRRPSEEEERDRAALARERRGRRSEEERRRTRAARPKPGVRNRPNRQVEIRRRWVALLTLLTVVAAVYLLFFSSMLGAKDVSVSGSRPVSADRIRAAGGGPGEKADAAAEHRRHPRPRGGDAGHRDGRGVAVVAEHG